MDSSLILFVVLAAVSAGALAYGFLFSRVQNERQAERRFETVRSAETDRNVVRASRDRMAEATRRRKSVQDTLKDIEEKQKARGQGKHKPPLKVQIRQAGLTMSIRKFYVVSAITGLCLFLLFVILGAPILVSLGAMIAGGLGLPRWFVTFMRARRVKAFLSEFPNALDVIVRAVKSGLPLNDAVRMIASESPEPVRSEFKRVVEHQQLGLSLPEAVLKMPETMPAAEASFFGIVIQIQSQAGGNLSEAIGNLSKVLRDRKKMKAKIQALSMEAKASAWIIGALPFIVAILVYLSSPGYIMPLFTTSTGHLILLVSGIWMSMGLLMMRKMMNFDF
ncbi:pilus assembly protein [Aliihoeflea aestuarii]|jgi:tight adherence protein B|uniref:type II secretion system F family protein n=1 Tax=Aliihoeflea aestuarii TaxID=453840 RepID=UPI002093E5BF|nr:type II secretion system F family protein [Aliihoeflea aestuarii]MCO6391463.1 pilus assembly protein [Aliihoeflea aestuarii]